MSSATRADVAAAELARRIDADLAAVTAAAADELGSALRCLLLGGGYGRGEGGGVERPDGRLAPYNDYDLVAIVGGVPRRRLPALRGALQKLGGGLEQRLGVEIELSPLRAEDLPTLPFTMMWCELLGGHRVLYGDPAVLTTAPALPPHDLPVVEGIRYLTNRGALLLWSHVEALPAERVWKFVHKAWLAVGAAALIGIGRFAVGYRARLAELEAVPPSLLPPIGRLVERYREASAGRLRPGAPPDPATIAARRGEAEEALLAAWAWLEERRVGRRWPTWRQYSAEVGLFAEPSRALPSLLARHLMLLRHRGLRPWCALREHPRSRTSRALPALLAGEAPNANLAALVGSGRDPADCARRCLDLWRRAS